MWLYNGGYELVGSGGACGSGLIDVEGSHRPTNPILDGKMRMLNEDDDDDECEEYCFLASEQN